MSDIKPADAFKLKKLQLQLKRTGSAAHQKLLDQEVTRLRDQKTSLQGAFSEESLRSMLKDEEKLKALTEALKKVTSGLDQDVKQSEPKPLPKKKKNKKKKKKKQTQTQKADESESSDDEGYDTRPRLVDFDLDGTLKTEISTLT